MTTAADLERIAALVDRLLPLGGKRRGELIEAEDWNTLVGAIIEIGRAAVAGNPPAEVPDHDHTDQVEVDWLDPRLRDLLTGGRDPGTDIELGRVRRDLGDLVGRLDKTVASVESVRLRVGEVATDVLRREADLTRLDRKVLGVDDSRTDLADLRSSLASIRDQVAVAVEVGSRLEVDGQPIDVAGLQSRVAEVEKLREALTRADGTVVDATEFDRTVAELTTRLVTQQSLTQALEEFRQEVLDRGLVVDRDALLEDARTAATLSATTSVDNLAARLQATLTDGLAGIEPTVARSVERATADLAAEVQAGVRSDVDQRLAETREGLRSELEAAFAGRLSAVSDGVTGRLDELAASITAQVTEQVNREVPQLLADVGTRLDQLEGVVQDLDSRVVVLDTTLVADRTRVEEGLRAETKSRTDLRTELSGRIDAVEAGVAPQVSAQVDAARAILRSELQSTVEAVRRDLTASLAETARAQAATEVQVLSTSIRTDVQSVIRQEIDASLETVRRDLAAEVAGLQQRIGGLVAAEVTRVAAEIPDRVAQEFESFKPEVTRLVNEGIERRGPISRGPLINRPPIG